MAFFLYRVIHSDFFPTRATPGKKLLVNNMLESTKSLLHSYHNEISNKLKTSESITIKDLSDLSWSVLEKEMTKNTEISSELRELSLQNVKELHSVATTRAHALGITSQTLFFLPDIIRAANTGNFEGLQKIGEMMLEDMAFNKMYDSLISKLGSVLPESRIALLKKLPITSPIFKILTIHSIRELYKQLNNLPADSEGASIIKHQLGEQYFTIGLMIAELFGLELGPLWVGLMAEQLVYGAIALRKICIVQENFNP
jgi:ribosomal protein S13